MTFELFESKLPYPVNTCVFFLKTDTCKTPVPVTKQSISKEMHVDWRRDLGRIPLKQLCMFRILQHWTGMKHKIQAKYARFHFPFFFFNSFDLRNEQNFKYFRMLSNFFSLVFFLGIHTPTCLQVITIQSNFFFYNYYNDLKISLKKRTRMRREPIRPERHPGGSGACKREAMVVKKEIFRGDRCTLGLGDPTQGGGRGARKQADLTVKWGPAVDAGLPV